MGCASVQRLRRNPDPTIDCTEPWVAEQESTAAILIQKMDWTLGCRLPAATILIQKMTLDSTRHSLSLLDTHVLQ